jgi:hypothetical protein
MATVGTGGAIGPILLLLGLLAAVPAAAQMPTPNVDIDIGTITVNYVYAAQLGFGGYSIGGLDVAVYTLPLAYTFDDVLGPGYDVRVRLALQYGNYQFQAHPAGQPKITLNANTLAGIPGAELRVPITKQWTLRPYAEWGLLTAFEPDTLTQLWSVGVRSVYDQPWRRFTFSLGNALLGAGNVDVNGGDTVQYGTLETGVAGRHPLEFDIGNAKPYGSLFFIWYLFFPDMQFARAYREPLRVQNQYEVGLSIGDFIPWVLWGLEEQQLGVSFRFGEFTAVHMNVGFPF